MAGKITRAKRAVAIPFATLVAVARHPELWLTALRQGAALVPPRWWKRWPPVPWPDAKYLEFRMSTAYGKTAQMPIQSDIVTYLQWCRRQRKLLK